jgi:hypothetical protein
VVGYLGEHPPGRQERRYGLGMRIVMLDGDAAALPK